MSDVSNIHYKRVAFPRKCVGDNVEQLEIPCFAGGGVNGTTTLEKSLTICHKIKYPSIL